MKKRTKPSKRPPKHLPKQTSGVRLFLGIDEAVLAGKKLTGKARTRAETLQGTLHSLMTHDEQDALIKSCCNLLKHKGPWKHTGGGTAVCSKDAYASDDFYQNVKLDTEVRLKTTVWRHFSMPCRVKNYKDLLRLPGVRFVKKYKIGE